MTENKWIECPFFQFFGTKKATERRWGGFFGPVNRGKVPALDLGEQKMEANVFGRDFGEQQT